MLTVGDSIKCHPPGGASRQFWKQLRGRLLVIVPSPHSASQTRVNALMVGEGCSMALQNHLGEG
jgi:hypothetical protein